ncbi:hypothetical protein GCM10007304_30070 [Rhodococcoides trifolii]|uniref:Uncharacterized protein n=2 Tax=Rhodococcoides trifolii TaxID=908250 RepID=A0A917LCS3_9NOCA|nr:hypothetical protein GCM10007304_30070 [Rhodococcus trifolii]
MQSAAVGLEQEGALAAAADHRRGADSLSGIAETIGRVFDESAVGDHYADLGAALTTGIESASAAIGRWSASSAAVADAVRTSVLASSAVDDSSATPFGEAGA